LIIKSSKATRYRIGQFTSVLFFHPMRCGARTIERILVLALVLIRVWVSADQTLKEKVAGTFEDSFFNGTSGLPFA